MADEGGPFDLAKLLGWPAAMANEVLALPETLRQARELVADLAAVANRITAVTDQVEAQLQNLIGPMARTVNQVDSIEASVTELRNTVFGVIKKVPGARRTILDWATSGERTEIEPG